MSRAQIRQAVVLIRSHLAAIAIDSAVDAHKDLALLIASLREEFFAEYDIPGARYWYVSPGELFFITGPNEKTPDPSRFDHYHELTELDRTTWLGKQGLYLNYDEERL